MSGNNTASVRARLKNVSDREVKPFDFILMLYFVERLLYRLSISRYGEQFVLKGGLLLYLIMEEKARPTKDIDLLAKIFLHRYLRISPVRALKHHSGGSGFQ